MLQRKRRGRRRRRRLRICGGVWRWRTRTRNNTRRHTGPTADGLLLLHRLASLIQMEACILLRGTLLGHGGAIIPYARPLPHLLGFVRDRGTALTAS